MTKKEQKEWLEKVKAVTAPTPFLAIDTNIAIQKIKDFKKHLPECELYYAVKAFNGEAFLKSIKPYIDGFDIASYGEFLSAEKQGMDPSRFLFSNPIKIPEHIEKTYKAGQRDFAFDTLAELHKLAQYAPGSNVYLRMKVSDHGSAFPLSAKFGANPEHAVPFMDTARDLGLNPVGLTFHVGSQSEILHAWDTALEICGKTMERLEKANIKLDFIDIGGGFPVEYTERVPDIEQIAKAIRESVAKHFPYKVQLKAEPGRYVVAESGLMVGTVIASELRGSKRWLFLDVGCFNGLLEPLEAPGEWKYPIFVDASAQTGSLPEFYTLTGPTCDSFDTFGFNVPLPSNVAMGDRVYIGSAGAYSAVYATDFNGFRIPECVYI